MSLCNRALASFVIALLLLPMSNGAFAGPLRDRIEARMQNGQQLDDDAGDVAAANLPAGIRIVCDIAYGSDAKQRFDVYAPAQARNAPVIFMVHGGGWVFGNKSMSRVVENKVRRWVPKGFIFVSVDYRLLPDTSIGVQAQDVASALAAAQNRAAEWGGDAKKFVLMGHSAGAHLVALIVSSPSLAANAGAKPWLGSVMLDSAAYDVAAIMQARHLPLYDRAFGNDATRWNALSPSLVLTQRTAPVLAICSTRRADSCAQAQAYVRKAKSLGTQAAVDAENKSHAQINQELGESGSYTDTVETFLRSLGLSVSP